MNQITTQQDVNQNPKNNITEIGAVQIPTRLKLHQDLEFLYSSYNGVFN